MNEKIELVSDLKADDSINRQFDKNNRGKLIDARSKFAEKRRINKFETTWLETSKNKIIQSLDSDLDNTDQLQIIINSFPQEQIAEAFALSAKSFGCSDGRTSYEGEDNLVKLGMAGGGIMLFAREVKADGRLETNVEWLSRLHESTKFKNFLKTLIDLNVKEIYGHDECGAAEKVNGKEMGKTDPLIFSEYMVLSLEEMGYYITAKHLNLEGENQMRNDIHDERMLVLDGTGRFNPEKLGFPSHFMVNSPSFNAFAGENEPIVSDKDLLNELETLCGVAKGHGFGAKFSEKEPFYIAITAKNQNQLDHLLKLAEDVKKRIPDMNIKINGYIYNN